MLSTESDTGGLQMIVTEDNKMHRISFKGDKTEMREDSIVLDKKA